MGWVKRLNALLEWYFTRGQKSVDRNGPGGFAVNALVKGCFWAKWAKKNEIGSKIFNFIWFNWLALVHGDPIATLLLLYIFIYNIYNNGPRGVKRPAQGMFLGWPKTVTENWPFSKVGITPGQDPLSKTGFLGLSKLKRSSPKYFKRADKNPHSLKFFFSFKVVHIALSIEELLQRI